MAKKNPYDSKKTFGIAEEERAARNQALGEAKGTAGTMSDVGRQTYEEVNPYFEQLYNPNKWKRTQTTMRTQSTNRAFNSAQAQNRMRARAAGFGYAQPASQAGETNIELGRASALSDIPGTVEAESIPITMGALQGRMQSGEQYGNALSGAGRMQLGVAGEYSPEQYYGTAVNQYNQEAARRGGLWKNIARVGLNVAGKWVPGLGAAGELIK